MKNLTLITGNPGKAEQIQRHLSIPVTHRKLDLNEIQSLDLEEITKKKAEEAFSILKSPVLVEDTSLIFPALGKLPGPLIKWFFEELGNEGLCKLLDKYEDRSAIAEVVFGLHTGTEVILFHSNSIFGSVATSPRGDKKFGWDPIFIPNGQTKTWAEMSYEEQDATSMRKNALSKLEKYLTFT